MGTLLESTLRHRHVEPRTPQACATCFHAHRIRTPSALTLLRRCHRYSPSSVPSDCPVRPSRMYPTATMLHLAPYQPEHRRALLDVFWYMILTTRSRLHEPCMHVASRQSIVDLQLRVSISVLCDTAICTTKVHREKKPKKTITLVPSMHVANNCNHLNQSNHHASSCSRVKDSFVNSLFFSCS